MPETLLLFLMMALEMLWLLTIWLTGSLSDPSKLPLVFASVVAVGAAVAWMPASTDGWLATLPKPLPGRRMGILSVLCPITGCAALAYAHFQGGHPPDEPFMLDAARIVAQQGAASFFESYQRISWLRSRHPPLMPLVYGYAMRIVGTDPSMLRLVPVAFLVLTVVVTYRLGRELHGPTTGALAAVLFLELPYVFRWGTALLTDMAVTFFFALALLLTVQLSKRKSIGLAVATGAIIGVGILTKYTMLFIFPLLIVYLAVVGRLRESLLHFAIVIGTAAAVVMPWVLYAYLGGVLRRQTRQVGFFTGVVMTGIGGRKVMLDLVLMNLPSGIGVFNLPLIALGGWHALRRRGPAERFVLVWVGTVSCILLLTMPDPRYFMITFPALAMLMARALETVPGVSRQAIVLALFYCASTLYLYLSADAARAARQFVSL